MAIVEDRDACTLVSVRIDSLIPSAADARILLHAGRRPPEAAAPHQVRLGHRVADGQIFRRAENGGAFEPGPGAKVDSGNRQVVSGVWMDAQEVTVKAITD